MNISTGLPLMGVGILVAAAACGQQSSVRVEGGEGEGQVHLVIENTLTGIGRMISASSGSRDVQVQYDPQGAAYHIRGADGSTVEIDARSGQYTIRGVGRGGVDPTVENGLAAVGAILRAMSESNADMLRGVEAVLSQAERDALDAVWRSQGLTQDQVDAYRAILGNADEIERYARQVEGDVRRIERRIEGAARGIEEDARQIEQEARQLEREARQTAREAERAAEVGRSARDEEAAFSCGGADELVLRGRTIQTDGVAVHAFGSCDVVIVDCEITSRSVAIRLEGNADLEIRASRIEGATASIEYGGNADVNARDSDFIGALVPRGGNAEFKDLGGNTFRDR